MKELINSFLEEANELIADLEDALLTLEENPDNMESVHRVFRVMHTLKGSGGMFGFDAVSNFTHHLENIYYQIRNEKLTLTKEILTLTLKSVDLIKELLKSPDQLPESVQQTYDKLVIEIKAVFEKYNAEEKAAESNSKKSGLLKTDYKGLQTYYIHFQPNSDILQNGTNPIYLIDELVSLGEAYVIADTSNIPKISEFKPDDCYISWEIILATRAELGDILDVFIFVEDESNIDIQHLCQYNLLQYNEFIEAIIKSEKQKLHLNTIELKNLGKKLVAKHAPVSEVTTEKIEIKSDQDKPETSIPKENQLPTKNESQTPKTHVSSYSTIRVSSQKIETLLNLVSEMVTSQARLNLLAGEIKNPQLSDVIENLEKLTRQLRDNAFEISLIPIESMVTRFRRLIRDLSAELKKEVNFLIEGSDTELDKTIIENLSDPLMHIFRNAIDHGIEDSETRKKNGKPEKGSITLKAFYSGTNVYIQIIDDGKGIDSEIIRKKAIEKGLIRADEQLSEKDIINLVTLPGFSTTEIITDISGRGVGLDVVKRNIQKISGEVIIDSKLGVGTTFTLKLPLTLSIIDGLILSLEDVLYIIPILAINKIRPLSHDVIEKAFNNTLVIDGEQIPFIYLRKHFGLTSEAPKMEQMIVVNYENNRIGIVIDKVDKQAQVVVKSIGKKFHNQDIISGASIMGNGQVALVLDTNKIINSLEKSKNIIKA